MSIYINITRRKLGEKRVLFTVAAMLMVLLAFPVAVGAAPLKQSAGDSGMGMGMGDMDKLKKLTGKEFETEFLTEMITHHRSAVDMSKLANTNASHQEVKDMAQQITEAQTKEIADMTGWLKQWYNVEPPASAMSGMSGMGDTLEATGLNGLSGDAFDKAFLTMMRVHHQGAVDMAGLISDRAVHAELKTLGQNITSSQTKEIKQFEGWLMQWYSLDVTKATSGSTPSSSMGSGNMGAGADAMPGTGEATAPNWIATLASLVALLLATGLLLKVGATARKRS